MALWTPSARRFGRASISSSRSIPTMSTPSARGSSSKAVSYIEILDEDEESWWGAGVDTDIIVASIKSLLSALNRSGVKEGRSESCWSR